MLEARHPPTPGAPAVPWRSSGGQLAAELLAWASIALVAVLFFRIDHSLGYSAARASGTWEAGGGRVDAVAQGSLSRQLDFLMLGAFAVVNLLRPRRVRVPWRSPGVVIAGAFLIWSFASLLWATAPWITARRLFGLLIVTVLVYSIGTRWPTRDIVRLFFVMTMGYLLVGIGAEAWNGTLLDAPNSRFSGTLFPGHQAAQCGVLIIALAWLTGERRHGRWILVLSGFVVFGFLILTESRTAVAAMLLALPFLWFLQGRVGWLLYVALGGVSAMALGTLLALNGLFPHALTVLTLGRGTEDAGSLTGRIPLWETLMGYVQERPLLGVGYNGYMTGDRAVRIANEVGSWAFGGAHNAYLSLALNLGLIGLALFLLVVGFQLVRVVLLRSEMQGLHVLFAAVLFFHTVRGMMDAYFLEPRPNFLGWLALGYLVLVPPPGRSSFDRAGPPPGRAWSTVGVSSGR